ncbi:MAG: hypothetical protein U9O56_04345 [Campylobacterota bacterium]|nr:hypothetical protein [Campylobacterota bacterium]
MINETIVDIKIVTNELIEATKLDIVDVKAARHEKLLERNHIKLLKMDELAKFKSNLNTKLSKEFQNGVDIRKYKEDIDGLEIKLKELYELNSKLGAIVLPVKEMYKDIIEDIKKVNGGSLVEVMA